MTLKDGLWVPAYPELVETVRNMCSAEGDFQRTRGGPGGNQRDIHLKRGQTHSGIVRMLSTSPQLSVALRRFDAEPYLLNTPNYVIDLRTGEGRPHEPTDLFAKRTAYSPDFGMRGPPKQWLAVVKRLTAGDPVLGELLQIYLGYCLTGYDYANKWELMLLLTGASGSGKSFIFELVSALIGSYAKMKKPRWFIQEKMHDDRFAYNGLEGVRFLWSPETIDNSTWDETRMVQLIDGLELDAEVKGGDPIAVRSQVKIAIAGNYEPRFPIGERGGGLPRRLVHLRLGEDRIMAAQDQDDKLLDTLLRTEGEQIMTRLIIGAYKALTLGKPGFLNLAQPLIAAAQEDAREADPRRLFATDLLVPGDPEKEYITLAELYGRYRDYRKATEDHPFIEAQGTFKRALAEILSGAFEKVARGEQDKRKHGYIGMYGIKWRDAIRG